MTTHRTSAATSTNVRSTARLAAVWLSVSTCQAPTSASVPRGTASLRPWTSVKTWTSAGRTGCVNMGTVGTLLARTGTQSVHCRFFLTRYPYSITMIKKSFNCQYKTSIYLIFK